MDGLFSILKFYRILLNFHFLHIQLQFINNFKSSLFLYANLCVTKNSPKLAPCSVQHNL